MKRLGIFLLLCNFMCITLSAQQELGTVKWLRDYDLALQQAEKTGKPILLLFQEVPGCATCRNYGDQVLSHPVIVDAIEHEFIPLAIYNNVGGADRKVLEKYGEPTWNNPVVRIINSKEANVLSRLSGNHSASGLVGHMSLALRAVGKGVPIYLDLLKQELEADTGATAYYQMYCFWSGESQLGAADGVVQTQPGFMNGAEVVQVKFDPEVIDKEDLDRLAEKASCNTVSKVRKFRRDKDPQYYLKKSAYRTLPLTEIQKTKINAALAANGDAKQYLSPTQLEWLDEGYKDSLYELPLQEAWTARTVGK